MLAIYRISAFALSVYSNWIGVWILVSGRDGHHKWRRSEALWSSVEFICLNDLAAENYGVWIGINIGAFADQ